MSVITGVGKYRTDKHGEADVVFVDSENNWSFGYCEGLACMWEAERGICALRDDGLNITGPWIETPVAVEWKPTGNLKIEQEFTDGTNTEWRPVPITDGK